MMLVIASTAAPRPRAVRIAASVSAVSPDCEIPITRSPAPTTGLRYLYSEAMSTSTGTRADRLGDCVRLLVDLLEHERFVPLLLSGLRVPVDLDCLPLELDSRRAKKLHAIWPQHDDLVISDVLNLAGVAQKGWNRRAD